ncbi:uncharacterized protein LOC116116711 isoform X2 [Pistacia vera]|uniref:uncharacterized protein LOC116116711 isoform X2 n=1 Tax=Pistacia vera TaxID=55513 RepID=UPI001262B3E1|nr:uncharacterized protein LOC116116711 isoform X2 [Pistacia vera]
MIHVFTYHLPILIYFLAVFTVPSSSHVGMFDAGAKILNVGEELWKESMALQGGTRLYHLQGLKSFTWRLLNTEKLIFKTDNLDVIDDQGGMYVLVTVEPEGIVAIPHVQEREFIIFNIVCDELLLGIPYEAWWVVVFVTICLILALIIPHFLPSYLLLKNGSLQSTAEGVSKES